MHVVAWVVSLPWLWGLESEVLSCHVCTPALTHYRRWGSWGLLLPFPKSCVLDTLGSVLFWSIFTQTGSLPVSRWSRNWGTCWGTCALVDKAPLCGDRWGLGTPWQATPSHLLVGTEVALPVLGKVAAILGSRGMCPPVPVGKDTSSTMRCASR